VSAHGTGTSGGLTIRSGRLGSATAAAQREQDPHWTVLCGPREAQTRRRIRGVCILLLAVATLASHGWAQPTTVIDGPVDGIPGQTLTFRLLGGGNQLPVDRWEQGLNPNRYTGNDYVSSSTLQMTSFPDGRLEVVAPAPGRYKIGASKGSERWETYVLVRPVSPPPEIRGASLGASEPLDRPYVSELLGVLKRAGMNWVDLVETAWIDFDSGNLAVQPYCPRCPASMPLEDLEWLIDEAHRQGLKVSLDLGVWARSKDVLDELQATIEGRPLNPTPFPSPVHNGPDPTDPAVIPTVMQSYKAFVLQAASLGQLHHAEALNLGNNTASPTSNLLWTLKDQWTDLVVQIRQVYQGKLWMGFEWTCPGGASFASYAGFDGIKVGLSGDIASTPACTFPLSGPSNPTAEELTQRIGPHVSAWRPFTVQAATGLPIIYTDFYTFNVDGVSYRGSSVFATGSHVQDNREIRAHLEGQASCWRATRCRADRLSVGGSSWTSRPLGLPSPWRSTASRRWR
jgi:hypothetical protein